MVAVSSDSAATGRLSDANVMLLLPAEASSSWSLVAEAQNEIASGEPSRGTGGTSTDEQAELTDKLTSLPNETTYDSSQSEQPDATKLKSQIDDPQVELAERTHMGVASQFNRLDPNRRSFSTPTVNFVGLVNARQPGTARLARAKTCESNKWPLAGSGSRAKQQQQRRRTALGIISFRLSGSGGSQSARTNQPPQPIQEQPQQAPVVASWRHWFTGKSTTNSCDSNRKFLLRNLKPATQQQQQQEQQQQFEGK